MKKTNIIGASVFALGLLVVIITFVAIGFNLDNLLEITKESGEIRDDFASILIESERMDVVIKQAASGKCGIEILTTRGATVKYAVENGVLTIKDECSWTDNLFYSGDNQVTIYLSKKEYKSLKLDGSSSDVTVNGVDFKNAEISASTGDVTVKANIGKTAIEVSTGDVTIDGLNGDSLIVKTSVGDVDVKHVNLENDATVNATTGDVNFEGVSIGGGAHVRVSTGDVELKRVSAKDFSAEASTGDIELESLVLDGHMKLETRTGDVELDRCDAASMQIKTSSGDVEGTLLTDKIFYIETSSGNVSVPKSTEGGMCQIATKSGDVVMIIVK